MMRLLCRFARAFGWAVAAMTAGFAVAQEVDHGAPDVVQSQVVVNGVVTQNQAVPKARAGLTVNGRVETEAERARRDAVDTLATATVLGTNHDPQTATSTTVVVKSVTVTGSARDSACAQIGTIGSQQDCRPSPR